MPYYYNPGFNPYPQQQMPMQQPQMPQQQMPQMAQPQQSGIIWVQGEVGAKSYLVAPNNSVVLWDNENPVIYVKSADPSGMPTMRIFDYKERVGAPPARQTDAKPTVEYVPRAEFDALRSQFDGLVARLDERPVQVPARPTKKVKEAESDGKSDV